MPDTPTKPTGPALLLAYLTAQNLTRRALAERLGWREATVSDYARGKKRPDLPYAVAMEKATDGAVPVESWVEPLPVPTWVDRVRAVVARGWPEHWPPPRVSGDGDDAEVSIDDYNETAQITLSALNLWRDELRASEIVLSAGREAIVVARILPPQSD